MLHRRFYGLDSTKDAEEIRVVPTVADIASKQATALRNRAARCRQLAATFYDQRIISELEAYASELEAEAVRLAIGSRSFRRA